MKNRGHNNDTGIEEDIQAAPLFQSLLRLLFRMSPHQSQPPLNPVYTDCSTAEYNALMSWPFRPSPFYEGQVLRLLQNDIPKRVLFSTCLIWIYHDPHGQAVGFGTLELLKEYPQFTGGKQHFYIPLLAVHPGFQGRGYGKEIVRHLTEEATKVVTVGHGLLGISDLLFLDVYVHNQAAIKLYLGQQFVTLNQNFPIADPDENGEEYIIMAKNVAAARSP